MTDTPAEPLALSRFLPFRLNVLAHVVAGGLDRLYNERFGFGIPEWRLIATLGEFGPMTARDIGAHSQMHKTKVSRAVATLEERGLLVRRANERDRREAFLSLTEAGANTYALIVPAALEHSQNLTAGLPEDDLAAFERIMAHLLERAGIDSADHDTVDKRPSGFPEA